MQKCSLCTVPTHKSFFVIKYKKENKKKHRNDPLLEWRMEFLLQRNVCWGKFIQTQLNFATQKWAVKALICFGGIVGNFPFLIHHHQPLSHRPKRTHTHTIWSWIHLHRINDLIFAFKIETHTQYSKRWDSVSSPASASAHRLVRFPFLGNLKPTANLYKQPVRISIFFVPIIIITFTKALKGVNTNELPKRFQNATERMVETIHFIWMHKKNMRFFSTIMCTLYI